jgi:hypothetical protein
MVFKQELHPLDIKKGSAPTVADFKDFSLCTREARARRRYNKRRRIYGIPPAISKCGIR